MSFITIIHYVIPTVEKKNTKKQCKLTSPGNVLRKSFFGLCNGTARKIRGFPLFSKFCSKKAVLPPHTTFFLVVGVVHPDWASFAAAKRCTVRDSEGLDGKRRHRWFYGSKVIVCKCVFIRLCVLLPLPLDLTAMVLPVLSVFGGVELGSAVVLLGVLLFVCWYVIREGNGV